MRNIISGFVTNVLIFSMINLLLLLFLLGRRLIMRHQQKRDQHFIALYRMPVQRIMERVAAGIYPVFHSYHLSHRPYIYRLMLAFAASEEGDFHVAFDYLGFTDDLLFGEINKSQQQLLQELAIIRSPMSKDYLYMTMLDGDQVSADLAAHALTHLELDPDDLEIILPSLINLSLPEERILELLNRLHPSRDFCLQLLEERHSKRFVTILSKFLDSCPAFSQIGRSGYLPALPEPCNPHSQTAIPAFVDDALFTG